MHISAGLVHSSTASCRDEAVYASLTKASLCCSAVPKACVDSTLDGCNRALQVCGKMPQSGSQEAYQFVQGCFKDATGRSLKSITRQQHHASCWNDDVLNMLQLWMENLYPSIVQLSVSLCAACSDMTDQPSYLANRQLSKTISFHDWCHCTHDI